MRTQEEIHDDYIFFLMKRRFQLGDKTLNLLEWYRESGYDIEGNFKLAENLVHVVSELEKDKINLNDQIMEFLTLYIQFKDVLFARNDKGEAGLEKKCLQLLRENPHENVEIINFAIKQYASSGIMNEQLLSKTFSKRVNVIKRFVVDTVIGYTQALDILHDIEIPLDEAAEILQQDPIHSLEIAYALDTIKSENVIVDDRLLQLVISNPEEAKEMAKLFNRLAKYNIELFNVVDAAGDTLEKIELRESLCDYSQHASSIMRAISTLKKEAEECHIPFMFDINNIKYLIYHLQLLNPDDDDIMQLLYEGKPFREGFLYLWLSGVPEESDNYKIIQSAPAKFNVALGLALLTRAKVSLNDAIRSALSNYGYDKNLIKILISLHKANIELNTENIELVVTALKNIRAFPQDKIFNDYLEEDYVNSMDQLQQSSILTEANLKFLSDPKHLDFSKQCSKALQMLSQANIIEPAVRDILSINAEDAEYIAKSWVFLDKAELLTEENTKLISRTDGYEQRIMNITYMCSSNQPPLDIQWKAIFKEPEKFDSILACTKFAMKAGLNAQPIVGILSKNAKNIDAIFDAVQLLQKADQLVTKYRDIPDKKITSHKFLTPHNLKLMCEQNDGKYAIFYALARIQKQLPPNAFKELLKDPLLQDFSNILNASMAFAKIQEKQSAGSSSTSHLDNLPYIPMLKIAMATATTLSEQSKDIIADAYLRKSHPEVLQLFSAHSVQASPHQESKRKT